MTVKINKNETEVEEGLTAEQLLASRGNPRAAIWVNGKQLLKAEYGSHVIQPGDEIKILRIAAGG
ncbi:MAG: sulfur carrier protein ThiS [Clostridiales bacterium]|nr:sulfur carrier protein ThiS [Clostridiales bacterium]